MEGTRHEKVVLIIAAYAIGFTTAFIAFGLSKMYVEPHVVFIEAKSTFEQKQQQVVHDVTTSVGFGEDGLYSITKDKERILAADRNDLAAMVTLSAAEPGFYYKIIDAEASRDGRFVYYCEQLTEEAANCDPYVYALEEDVLYHVKVDGQALYPIIENHESMWTGESSLMVNGAVSVSADQPWQLSSVSEVTVQ